MRLNISHIVSPEQYEVLRPGEVQAHEHVLQFDLMGLDLRLALALTPSVQLEMNLPYRWAFVEARFLDVSGRELDDFASIHHRTETISGLGDLAFELRYRVYGAKPRSVFRADVTMGVMLPTGHIEPDPFQLGRQKRSHQHIFFGTGTINPIVSLELARSFNYGLIRLRTGWDGAVYRNREHYQGPQTLRLAVELQSRFQDSKWQFKTGAEFMRQRAAQWKDQPAENSGRVDMSPTLGVDFRPISRLGLTAEIRRPFVISSGNSQFTAPFIFLFGLNVTWELANQSKK